MKEYERTSSHLLRVFDVSIKLGKKLLSGIILILIGNLFFGSVQAQTPLVKLEQPGPWMGVSKLIQYQQKLYFVNSQVYVNHNSADIYSYDFEKQTFRFEKRLFSQDAGDPVIINGLLYWPYEDPRFSAGNGEFEITNGKEWQWVIAPKVRSFHVHAMTEHQQVRYLLASAWKGRIYRFSEKEKQWNLWYEHPTPPRRVSRITQMVTLNQTHYWALTARAEKGVKLLYNQGDTVQPVPGFPEGQLVSSLATFQNSVYAVNHASRQSRVWRLNGQSQAKPVSALDGVTVYVLRSSPTLLMAGGKDEQGGVLWQTRDGIHWTLRQRFPATPIDVLTFDEHVFVGTYSKKGGELWGTNSMMTGKLPDSPQPLPKQQQFSLAISEQQQMLDELEEMLEIKNPTTFRNQFLRRAIPLALTRNPEVGEVISTWLSREIPDKKIPLFGNIKISSRKLTHWYLLYAMVINGHGTVPQKLILLPWTSPPNRAEKYIESSVAAAWAVAQLRQNDPKTLQGLRLMKDHPSLPKWARHDFEAAIHQISSH